jgi:tetratricopeptide (TPR) repeat protein
MRVVFVAIFCVAACALFAADAPVPSAEPIVVAAREYESGNLDQALAILDEMAKDGSTQKTQAYDLRGLIYLEQAKYDDAISAFKAAHYVDREFFPPRIHHADALLRKGDWQEARNTYTSLMTETRILSMNERLRYGAFLATLIGKAESEANALLGRLTFPTETAAYYYAQAAWAFSQNDKRGAAKWLKTADEIYKPKQAAWFARPLHDQGWIKEKPPLVAELTQ